MNHDDFCRLSRVFNLHAYAAAGTQDDRINEWLKNRIAASKPSPVARDGIEAQRGLNDVFPGDPYLVPDNREPYQGLPGEPNGVTDNDGSTS